MGGEGACLFVAHTHPLDPAFGNVVRDHVESITHDAVAMLDARAFQRLNDDLCDLLAHSGKPLFCTWAAAWAPTRNRACRGMRRFVCGCAVVAGALP